MMSHPEAGSEHRVNCDDVLLGKLRPGRPVYQADQQGERWFCPQLGPAPVTLAAFNLLQN